MLRFKNFAMVLGACVALSACTSSVTPTPEKMALLTAEQHKVLASDVEPNVVRDAVDGGIVASL